MTLTEDAGRPVGSVGTFWGSHVYRASASVSGLEGQSGVSPAAPRNPAASGVCACMWGLGGGALG